MPQQNPEPPEWSAGQRGDSRAANWKLSSKNSWTILPLLKISRSSMQVSVKKMLH
jgi:hypothetical protein